MVIGALPPNPEPQPKTTKRHDDQEIKDNHVNEEQYYLQKIQQLVDQKMALFSQQNQASSSNDNQESKIAITDANNTKKRPRSPSDDDDGDEYKIKKQKNTKKITPNKMYVRSPVVSNEKTEGLKKFVTEELNGSDMKLVIQKILYATDLAKTQNRLSMPINQLETVEFLTAEEKQLLDEKGGAFDVPLLGPTLQMHRKPMTLIKWNLKTTSNYVLKTNWHHFVEANSEDLTVKTKVQVWSFRREEKLCLALVCVGRAD